MSEPGHNSSQQLKSIVERVERLGMEIKGLQSDQKDIFAEAKSQGWDVKALRMILRMRQQDPDERAQFEALLDTYKASLGMS